jgi:tetratricopeptide (TPR) repeat protein
MFNTAEKLFIAAVNNEGVNEVLRRRGILYREQGKYDDARAQFQTALNSARTLGSEAQQITELIELSYLASTNGDSTTSEKYAQEAVSFAQENHLENLATSGLLELGNSYSSRGDYKKAEEYFLDTIKFAQANKGREREARGKSNLGGLYIQTLRVDEGLKLVHEALEFFKANNYPRNVSFCLTQIGRGYRRKGDYTLAVQALNEKLELAKRGNNQILIADCYAEIGAVLFDQQNYPAALQQYDSSLTIYQGVGNKLQTVFNKANRGNILWRLGRYDEARALLAEVSATANESKNDYKQLIPVLQVVDSEMFLSQRRFGEAQSKGNEAVTLAGRDYTDVVIESKFVIGLAKALSGNAKDGQALCEEAVKLANGLSDANLLSLAMLAQAEAALKANSADTALTLALQAQQRFATGGQLESEWRAWLIAAQASQLLGDKNKADEQLTQAKSARSRLEQQWGAESFKTYVLRPDIQVYYKELG